MAARLMQSALTIFVIGPALYAHISAGDAAFENSPEKTISSCTRRHIGFDQSINQSIDRSSSALIDLYCDDDMKLFLRVCVREGGRCV